MSGSKPGGGWVSPVFARHADPVPLHIRMEAAGCTPNPAEPRAALEGRISAVIAADQAIAALRAADLAAGKRLLAVAYTQAAAAVDAYNQLKEELNAVNRRPRPDR